MNRNTLIIRLIVLLINYFILIACSHPTNKSLNMHIDSNLLIVSDGNWDNNIIISVCDIDSNGIIPLKIDYTKKMLYVLSPCCYLRKFELHEGNYIDSIKVGCYDGEESFVLDTLWNHIIISSTHRIWIISKDKLNLNVSLIDTINRYLPKRGDFLYSFNPLIKNNDLTVSLKYKTYSSDSTFNYQLRFSETFRFPESADFTKIPIHNYILPIVEE